MSPQNPVFVALLHDIHSASSFSGYLELYTANFQLIQPTHSSSSSLLWQREQYSSQYAIRGYDTSIRTSAKSVPPHSRPGPEGVVIRPTEVHGCARSMEHDGFVFFTCM